MSKPAYAQDIADMTEGKSSVFDNVLPEPRWPVFSGPSIAGFEDPLCIRVPYG